MNGAEQLEQRIDELVQGVLAGAREVALAAVVEAFARNEEQLLRGERNHVGHQRPSAPSAKVKSRRGPRPGKKRGPEELATLGEKLCAAICEKPGETMTYYAERVSSTPRKLSVPVRRLLEEGRVRSVGDRNQRKYYPGARE